MAADAKEQPPTTPTLASLLGLKSDCKASFVRPRPQVKDATPFHVSLCSPQPCLMGGGGTPGQLPPSDRASDTQRETPPSQIPALRAVRPYRPKTLAKTPFNFAIQPAIFMGRQRAIYIHHRLAGKVMGGHSSPSARHLARQQSISYRGGQTAVVGPVGDVEGMLYSDDMVMTPQGCTAACSYTLICVSAHCAEAKRSGKCYRCYFGISVLSTGNKDSYLFVSLGGEPGPVGFLRHGMVLPGSETGAK